MKNWNKLRRYSYDQKPLLELQISSASNGSFQEKCYICVCFSTQSMDCIIGKHLLFCLKELNLFLKVNSKAVIQVSC